MAKFKNPGGGMTFHLVGKDVRVGEGEVVSTSNEELKTALRKQGWKSYKEPSSEKEKS